MHNVTEIKMSPTTEDACLAGGQEQNSMPAIAKTWQCDWVPHNKVVCPPLSKACLLSGDLTQHRDKTKAPYRTFGCIPTIIWLGPSLAICQGCAFPPLGREGSAHAEQPYSRLCLVCSSWEVRKQDALASSLRTASLNFFQSKECII